MRGEAAHRGGLRFGPDNCWLTGSYCRHLATECAERGHWVWEGGFTNAFEIAGGQPWRPTLEATAGAGSASGATAPRSGGGAERPTRARVVIVHRSPRSRASSSPTVKTRSERDLGVLASLEDFHFREKIFHFDHERIPERVVHARGFGAHGFFENYESACRSHPSASLPRARTADARLRTVLDRRRQQGIARSRARRPRLRGQALHPGGKLGSRRQQHPGLLHPGRN